jgi:hypothetical protein
MFMHDLREKDGPLAEVGCAVLARSMGKEIWAQNLCLRLEPIPR